MSVASAPSSHAFFATTPKGLESLLLAELAALGAAELRETRAGVAFHGPLALAYRACLWSRLANSKQQPHAHIAAPTPEAMYAGAQTIAWEDHFCADDTLAVDFATVQSQISHSHFGALKVKDAIVDRFRAREGRRPSVEREQPSVRSNVYLHRDHATVYLDLSGDSLHRRRYRSQSVAAPLKENVACGALIRALRPEISAQGGTLLDEGAMMAADFAPGLQREYYGFLAWRGHDATLWSQLIEEAETRRAAGLQRLPKLFGFDADARAVQAAQRNVAAARMSDHIVVEQCAVQNLCAPAGAAPGLVICNPPYGERLGDAETLMPLYAELGAKLKTEFTGWRAAVLTANPDLGKKMGLRARKRYTLYNGALECKLLYFDVPPEWFVTEQPIDDDAPLSSGAEMLANRLRKNRMQLARWLELEQVPCYRLYDADLPEYAVAVDVYQGERLWAHVQEYAPPASVDPKKAELRLRDALRSITAVLDIPREQVYLKVRQQQKGKEQYQALADGKQFHEVREGPCRLLVNFSDYHNTGLFLDHRPVRAYIRAHTHDKHEHKHNANTGAATAHAAAGGASSTTTVDMSQTYLEWARRNMALNGYTDQRHRYLHADCTTWLEEQAANAKATRYDLIFLDPPTFSNSKRMSGTFDVQRDHVELIRQAVTLLAPGGVLLFSTNFRRFKMDGDALADLQMEDISRAMLPPDYARDARIHQVWRIKARD